MNEKENFSWSGGQLLGLAGLLAAAITAFHLGSAAAGYPLYRDIHLGAALEYARSHIDLLRPVIVGFNATRTPTPQELPLWQALAALAFKGLGAWYGWANVISLLFFFGGLYPLFRLAQTFLDERCARWTLVFFLAQPLIFVFAGVASTDGFSLACSLWFLFFAVRLLAVPNAVWWILTCITGAIAAVSKLPFFMAAGLGCFFLVVTQHRRSLRAWLLLGSAAALITMIFFAWTAHVSQCLAQAEFAFVDLRLSDPQQVFWFFGDWHYRLSPGNWIKGGWRILNCLFGSFALAGLFFYALFFLKGNAAAKASLLGAGVTTLVFSHLVLHHSHYYLMFCPAVAMLCAQAAADWEKRLVIDRGWKACAALGLVALLFGLSLAQGLTGMKVILYYDRYPHEIAKIIQAHSAESDKLLIEGGGWGGQMLILSHRQGLSIWNTKIAENQETFRRLKQLGFNKLVMISESPLLTALQKVNPGQTQLQRETYHQYLTPIAKDWPTLYQSEDVLIKQIP